VLLTVRNLFDRRVLFFGGKGGVGKTTCSSAMALAASRAGRRVLLVSTDPAHSTSDAFGTPLGPEESQIRPNLWGVELDEEGEARRYLQEAKTRLSQFFKPEVVREAARHIELAGAMPGTTDVALFDRMTQIILERSLAFDLVVFDTAPTGHALRLLRMPELMSSWIGALRDRRRSALEAASLARRHDRAAEDSATARAGSEGRGAGALKGAAANLSGDAVLEVLEARAERLERVREELTRPDHVAFVLVLVAERLAIEESVRNLHLLEETGIALGAILVNRVLPERADGEFLRSRKEQERVYLDEIERRFGSARRVMVPQLPRDVAGIDSLEVIAGHLLAAP
jgi:arsenite-transporting ATPase